VVRIASASAPYDITVAFFSSDMRPPASRTAQALARRSPPPVPSVVEDASSHCSALKRRSIRRCQSLPKAWRTRIATMIWCIANTMPVEAQARPST